MKNEPPDTDLNHPTMSGLYHDVHIDRLGHPKDYPYTAGYPGGWNTWSYESHIERLYTQVDLLLAYIKELEARLQGQK